MKKIIRFLIVILLTTPVFINAQTYVDPDLKVEANVFAYKLDAAPAIDGNTDEWAGLPWQKLYFQDRDFNGDGIIDPLPSRDDYEVKFKAGWVDGINKLFLLIDIKDDIFYNPEEVNWYNKDGMEIRLDPFDSEAAGEPSAEGTAFNLGFTVGQNQSSGLEGPTATYEAFWTVDETVFPKSAVLETSVDLPSAVALTADYQMGFLLYCSDNDGTQDDSPGDKDAVLTSWPQRYYAATTSKIGIDGSWENIYYWGNIICIAQTVHNVAAGASIQAAVDAANPGDIIKVAAGEFTENIVINTSYLYLEGTITDTDSTIIKPALNGLPVIQIAGSDSAVGVTISSFNLNGQYDDAGNLGRAQLGIKTGSALTKVINNYISYFEFATEQVAADVNINAYACVYEDNFSAYNRGGIDFYSPQSIARYNMALGQIGGYAIDAKGLPAENMIDIAYNGVFNHQGECAIGYEGSGVFTIHHNYLIRGYDLWSVLNTSGDDGIENQSGGGSTDYIFNNTIVGWKSDGMQLGNGESKFFVRNNLIAYQGAKDYDIRNVDTVDIDYGLSFNNGLQSGVAIGGGPSQYDSVAQSRGAQNMIVADPLFLDELSDDYTIEETSPAVDKGLKEPFGFKTLYFGDAPDIGAFETGSVPVSVDGKTGDGVPAKYSLEQNYPNPFNPSTKIKFDLQQSGVVSLKVYNLLGQEVATLFNGDMNAGSHEIIFNAKNLTSGIYFYTLTANNFSSTKKMSLIK